MVALLREAIHRRDDVDIDVAALLNDTTGPHSNIVIFEYIDKLETVPVGKLTETSASRNHRHEIAISDTVLHQRRRFLMIFISPGSNDGNEQICSVPGQLLLYCPLSCCCFGQLDQENLLLKESKIYVSLKSHS